MYTIGYTVATCFDLNGHRQANKEHFVKVQVGITQWDPISFTVEYKIMKKFLFTIKTIKMSSKQIF